MKLSIKPLDPAPSRGMTNSHSAYTLIELLLVVFIIGIIATLAINIYQKESLSSKINKTAIQMQQILQAANAYYVDNGCWPMSSQNNACKQCPGTPANFNQYLNLGTVTNPFGNTSSFNYSYQPEPQSCKKFQVFSGELPSPQIRDRIIANLPSGIPATSGAANQVMTETVVPPQIIKSAGVANYNVVLLNYSDTLTNGSQGSFSFNCPTGWTGGGFVVPFILNPYDWITNGSWCVGATIHFGPGSNVIGTLSAPVSCSGQNAITCNYTVTFQSNVMENKPYCPWGTTATGTLTFLQAGYCINPNPQGKKKPFSIF